MSASQQGFVDTNIWVYGYSSDEPKKQAIVGNIIEEQSIVVSTQVLSEFSNVLNKKFKTPWATVQKAIAEIISSSRVSIVTPATINDAIALAQRYKFSYYDSLIIAAALENNCEYLYSEDFAHLQIVDGTLKILNPFK